MTNSYTRHFLLGGAGLILGLAAAIAVVGTRSTAQTQLAEKADLFSQLSEQDQHLLRLSFRDYLAQPTERQQLLQDIHTLSRSSPAAKTALARFGNWWKDLSRADWDAWAALDENARLKFVEDRWSSAENSRASAEIEIRFPATYERFFPRLHMTHAELEAIVFQLVPETERPAPIQQVLNGLPNDRLRSLSLILWMFRQLAEQGEQPQRNEVVAQKMKFMKQLLVNNVHDDDWNQKFQTALKNVEGRGIEVYWLTPVVYAILGQSATHLGRELLADFPVSDDAVLAEFDRIPTAQQQELMQLPPAQARARLQFLAQIQAAKGPQQLLLQQFAEYSRNSEQLMRTATFGFGTTRRSQR
ncbi:MAG: hypothetical protein ACK45A_01145 [Planctomyces sp.]